MEVTIGYAEQMSTRRMKLRLQQSLVHNHIAAFVQPPNLLVVLPQISMRLTLLGHHISFDLMGCVGDEIC